MNIAEDSGATTAAKKRGISISVRIIIVQMIVVLVAMGSNGIFSYLQVSKRLNDALRQRSMQLIKRLPSSLVTPMWNIDMATVDDLVGLEMADADVQAIVLKNEAGPHGQMRDAGGKVVPYTAQGESALSAPGTHRTEGDIAFQGKSIGTVAIYVSDINVRRQLQAELLKTAGATAVVILLLAFTTFLISRLLVSRPLAQMGSAIDRIAQGDLSKGVVIRSRDELGDLAQAINNMVARLSAMVLQIREAARVLTGSSEQIFANAQSLSEGAQSQASTLEETSASVEELNASVEQVPGHAQSQVSAVSQGSASMDQVQKSIQQLSHSLAEISELAASSVEKSKEGAHAVGQVVDGITLISEGSEKIGGIVTVISEIADQTNLLSLNASIEAARAGEHGRGFAVVADEVSKLADRSSSSAKEIEGLIKESVKNVSRGVEIANGSQGAMEQIGTSSQKVQAMISELARSIEQQVTAIKEMAGALGNVSEMSRSISLATVEQSTNAKQVAAAVESVNQLTQNAASSAEEMSSATEQLSAMALQLQKSVDQFTLSGTGSALGESVNRQGLVA